jgi:hypothetical protein
VSSIGVNAGKVMSMVAAPELVPVIGSNTRSAGAGANLSRDWAWAGDGDR